MTEPVVVDTNVLFSALLGSTSSIAQHLLGREHSYFVCEAVIVELFKHKERIVKLSQLSEDEVVHFYHILLRRVEMFKEDLNLACTSDEGVGFVL